MSPRAMLGGVLALAAGISLSLSTLGQPLVAQQSSSAALHEQGIVVDGHVHITNRVFWEGIDPWKVQETGLWDYARAKQGGLDVVIEQVYLEDPFNNYNYAVKQAVRLVETFHRVMAANSDKMELALSEADVRRIVGTGKMAVILALEGGFDMEGDLDVLRLFHRLGVRLIQFSSHNTTNAFADAGLGEKKWKGITSHGRSVIGEMNRLGIMIDISHASDEAQLQIIESSAAPVVASHHGMRHLSSSPRTLSDAVLKALAAKGGLVGIHSSAGFLSDAFVQWAAKRPNPEAADGRWYDRLPPPGPRDDGKYIAALDAENRRRWRSEYEKTWRRRQQDVLDAGGPLPTVDDWANHVAYAVSLAGEDAVGIGLDAMRGGEYMRDFDATSYPKLTEGLVKKGFAPGRIRKIQGENWLRVFDAAKVPAGALTAGR